MTIKYSLKESYFNKSQDAYVARVHSIDTMGLQEIAEQMVREGAILSAGNITTILKQAIDVIESFLIDGYRVNIEDLVHLYPTIRGTFTSMTDGYDPARHSMQVRSRAGKRLNDTVLSESNIEKVATTAPQPQVFEYVDIRSEQINTTVTASATAAVRGNNLKFNTEAEDEGIFFINTDDFSEIKAAGILRRTSGEVIFQAPAEIAAQANYTVEVRCRVNGGRTLRSGTLDHTLTGA